MNNLKQASPSPTLREALRRLEQAGVKSSATEASPTSAYRVLGDPVKGIGLRAMHQSGPTKK